MKRSEFLKRMGLGIVAIPLAPKAVAEAVETIQKAVEQEEAKEYHLGHCRELYKRYGEKDIQEVMDIYRETGDLVYYKERPTGVHITEGKYPLRINDVIEVSEKEFVITYMDKGLARCVSTDMWHDVIYIDMEDFNRFYFFGGVESFPKL